MDATYRREVKYRVPLGRVPALRAELAAFLGRDPHAGPDGSYLVSSLYFETATLALTRAKVAGLHERVRLRVRRYGDAPGALAEIKHKVGDRNRKERVAVTPAEIALLCEGRHGALLADRGDDPVLRRFVATKAALGCSLTVLVTYRREAFVAPGAGGAPVRATLDLDLRAAPAAGLFGPGRAWIPLLAGEVVLEVKTGGAPPAWWRRLVEGFRLRPEPVSKFELGCRATYASLGLREDLP